MNKFLIPAVLVATVVIAGIFAFMPVEKASTVHGTLATTAAQTTNTNTITANTNSEIDAQDRAMYFKFNQSDTDSGVHTLIPKKTGRILTVSWIITATPNESPASTVQAECGLVTVGQGALTGVTGSANTTDNAVKSNSVNGTVTTSAGDGLALQFSAEANVARAGTCEISLFIDSISGE